MLMKRKFLSTLLVFCLMVLVAAPVPAEATTLPISARSALLLDLNTGKVLFSKAPHTKRAPASTTKLLTAMVTLDRMAEGNVVTISSLAEKAEPTYPPTTSTSPEEEERGRSGRRRGHSRCIDGRLAT